MCFSCALLWASYCLSSCFYGRHSSIDHFNINHLRGCSESWELGCAPAAQHRDPCWRYTDTLEVPGSVIKYNWPILASELCSVCDVSCLARRQFRIWNPFITDRETFCSWKWFNSVVDNRSSTNPSPAVLSAPQRRAEGQSCLVRGKKDNLVETCALF